MTWRASWVVLAVLLWGVPAVGQEEAIPDTDVQELEDVEPSLRLMHAGLVRFETSLGVSEGTAARWQAQITGLPFVVPLGEASLERGQTQWSLALEMFTFNNLDMRADETESQEVSFFRVLGAGVRVDRHLWGLQLGGALMEAGIDDLSFLTPSVALRLGEMESGPMFTARADFEGMHAAALDDRARSLSTNLVARASLSAPAGDPWRFHLRGRYQDRRGGFQGLVFRDAWLGVGVEGAIDIGLRVMPAFLGLGLRQVFRHAEGGQAVEPSGRQAMLWFEVQLGVGGRTLSW